MRIGVLAPLTRPGWVPAGEHLLAGMRLAVQDVNGAGGIHGTTMELAVRDTAGDPSAATAAVDELAGMGVAAVAGEYHSVVARAAAARADSVGLPFLCSSAVLDELTDHPSKTVARLAPTQSRGWRVFAEYLVNAGHRRISVVTEPSVYWQSGVRILGDVMAEYGGELLEIEMSEADPEVLRNSIVDARATALLLLVGFPDPAVQLVEWVRSDPRLADILIGAPAGQPEFAEWARRLGSAGAAVPFLRYLPREFGQLGRRVKTELARCLGESPSFVAFEGYDTITVLAAILASPGAAGDPPGFEDVSVEGTRGVISFSRNPGTVVWQWVWAPVQVADRNPTAINRFRVLHVS